MSTNPQPNNITPASTINADTSPSVTVHFPVEGATTARRSRLRTLLRHHPPPARRILAGTPQRLTAIIVFENFLEYLCQNQVHIAQRLAADAQKYLRIFISSRNFLYV